MTGSWATSLDLHLDVRPGGRGTGAALTRALRDAIRGGRLTPGTRLPSSRALAADLGLARNTVADAYAHLVAEGWLTARQGSGTRVAPRSEVRREKGRPAATPPHPMLPRTTYNLMPGSPDVSSFPRTGWAAATRRALTNAPSRAFGYQPPNGRPELRAALAGYLARVRGVHADPERIVVCAGMIHGLWWLGEVLQARGDRAMAVETYGLHVHRGVFTRAGFRLAAMPYDDRGTLTEGLPDLGVQVALLTPSHQFPTGVPLPPDRRARAIDWARTSGGVILEDDYDGEFRYDRQPIGALQGLDPERVVYLGTASKSLAPALRLGWMVLPERLVDAVLAVEGAERWQVPVIDQLVLADFLETGAFDKHVRGMRLRYRRRRDRLAEDLRRHVPHVRVRGVAAGLHMLLELPEGTEQEVIRRAAREGVTVAGLGQLTFSGAFSGVESSDAASQPGSARDGIIVGFATPPDHLFPGAVAALCRALGE